MIAEKIGSLEASFHTAIERLHQTTPPDGLKEAHKRLASNLLADFLKELVTPEVPAEAPVVVEATGEEDLGEGAPETTGEGAPVEGEVAE